MSTQTEADAIVRNHMLWAFGAGLMPLPLLDIAAVTAIQMDLVQQLARHYNVDYSTATGKTFVSALAGSTLAKIGASMVKAIPGLGSIIGGVSMAVLSGASTYAVGEVMIKQLAKGGDFLTLDLDWAKDAYNQAYERGKEVLKQTQVQEEKSRDVFEALEKLGALRDQGVITEADFEAQKQKLLGTL
ncbi:MAG: DUF697 domain-containing protein [Herpetosiphonaceae bacterium]|nr:DUF697 domain-containing protein [Herpetosiphonaceae bacterium]